MTEKATPSMPGSRPSLPRIPLNTLAVSFGLAGLAGVWTIASEKLAIPRVVPELFWALAAIAWVWLIVAHLARGRRSSDTLLSQLKHPAQGPIASIVPAVGMLLGAHLFTLWPAGGIALVSISLLAAALFAGWILAFWQSGRLAPESVHGAYLLPTAGSSLIAATTSHRVGLGALSMGAFAIGIFFAAVIFAILLARVAFLPPLPDALIPTLAITLAPPAVGGTAWFAMQGEHSDPVSLSLLGLLVLMLLVQLFRIGVYRRLPFTLGIWSFTFPVAASAGFVIQWFSIARFTGWTAASIAALAVTTLLIGGIGIRSLVLVATVRRGIRRAEQTLRRADDSVEEKGT